jgi:hypothetical protein
MKTWQRILVVTVLLGIGTFVGFNRLADGERMNRLSMSNLRVIGLGVMMYADDWDSKLPNLSDAQSLKKAVAGNIATDKSKAEIYFVHPKTGIPYQPNSSLSYKELRELKAPSEIAVVYEDAPARDGTRGVLFGDCHVERVNESRWQLLKKTSNIL